MSGELGTLEFAMKLAKSMRSVAVAVIDQKRPPPRYATVMAINTDTKSCMVQYPGETDWVKVPYNSIAPNEVGQNVRIEGTPGDRFITAVIGTSKTDAKVADVDATATGAATTAGTALSTANDAGMAASSAVTVANGAQTTVGQVATNINVGVNGGAAVGTGDVAAVATNISTVNATGVAAAAAAAAAQLTLQQQQDATNGGASGGKSLSYSFSGADGTPLSSVDFTTTSGVGIKGGLAAIATSAAVSAMFDAIINANYDTDNESIAGILGVVNNPYAYSYLILRSDSAFSKGAYCRFNNSEVAIGYFTTSGGTRTYQNPWLTQGVSIAQGQRVEFRALGLNYYVYVNGTQKISYTNSADQVTRNATQRRSGFVMQRVIGGFGYPYDSPQFSAITISDYAIPGATVTTSWRLTRGVSGGVSQSIGNGSSAIAPNNFFTTSDYANGVTTSTTDGSATVTKAGFYFITASFASVITGGSAGIYVATYYAIWVNGAKVTGPIVIGASKKILLAVGDKVQVGAVALGYSQGDGSINPINLSSIAGGPGAVFDGEFANA